MDRQGGERRRAGSRWALAHASGGARLLSWAVDVEYRAAAGEPPTIHAARPEPIAPWSGARSPTASCAVPWVFRVRLHAGRRGHELHSAPRVPASTKRGLAEDLVGSRRTPRARAHVASREASTTSAPRRGRPRRKVRPLRGYRRTPARIPRGHRSWWCALRPPQWMTALSRAVLPRAPDAPPVRSPRSSRRRCCSAERVPKAARCILSPRPFDSPRFRAAQRPVRVFTAPDSASPSAFSPLALTTDGPPRRGQQPWK